MTTKEYKKLKKLKKENLRDNMTNLELVLNMLAETAITEISQKREANKQVAQAGGGVAGNVRKEIERKSKSQVIISKNAKDLYCKKTKKLN